MNLLFAIFLGLGLLTLLEAIIPLHARGSWHRAHLGPNLALTLLALAIGLVLNAGVVVWIAWLDERGFGLLRWLALGPVAGGVLGVLALDLSTYAIHRSMHGIPALWKVHRVHHSDPVVDVTTALRQHPVEGLLRYAAIGLTATLFGVGLAEFAIYRAWSVLNALPEHANIRLPRWLDRGMALISVSPDMHKVHHSRDVRETNTNYGNVFSIFDRALATFTPPERGRTVAFGLDGFDAESVQTSSGLLRLPFRPAMKAEPPMLAPRIPSS